MDVVGSLPAFLLVVVLISASPGPAVALILRRAAVRGTRAAVSTVLGIELGLFLWALAAGAGLAVVVAASQLAYTVLRFVGAAVGRASRWFRRPAVRRRLDALTGTVLVGLSARMALTSR